MRFLAAAARRARRVRDLRRALLRHPLLLELLVLLLVLDARSLAGHAASFRSRWLIPAPARCTHGLRRPNPGLTAPSDAAAMRHPITLAIAIASLAVGVPTAGAAAADPTAAVKADIAQLQKDLSSAHDTLIA